MKPPLKAGVQRKVLASVPSLLSLPLSCWADTEPSRVSVICSLHPVFLFPITYFYLSSVLTLRLNIVDREEPSKKLIIGARSWDQKKIRIRANRRDHSISLFPPLHFQRAKASPWPCMLCAGLCWVPSVMTLFSPMDCCPQALSTGFSRQKWIAMPFSSPSTISSHKLPSPFREDLTLWIILYVGPSNTEWGNVFEENLKM